MKSKETIEPLLVRFRYTQELFPLAKEKLNAELKSEIRKILNERKKHDSITVIEVLWTFYVAGVR